MDPFVEEMTEVEDYKRLLSKPLTAPRDLDWGILDDLLISEDVKRYLELLVLTVFENIALETFPKLTLEFFSTVAMHDNGKYLTALASEFITERDLSSVGFIYDRFYIRPVHERKSYKNYLEDLQKRGPASEPSHTAVGPSGAGTDGQPDHGASQPPPATDGPSEAFSEHVPAWFTEFQTRNDEHLRSIQADMMMYNANQEARWKAHDDEWRSYTTTNDARWTALNAAITRNDDLLTAHDSRWDAWEDKQQ
ncbi:NADH-quinone oxidoreductase subunit D 1 [Striga asiatica]|uniref:NADH-quinone oxidoreductase subunit D 1 n=1 Tax=Striga asiatica TaxID=4170 RepID=A0A5A7Q2C1_STRAF|nr:NADH-quinone oxidoreductase subunit D 1 [Striga asiatica]